MDSTQAWFCRDLWIDAAKDGGMRSGRTSNKEAQMGPWGAAEEEQEDRRGAGKKKVDAATTTTTTSSEEPSPTQDEAFKAEQNAQNEKIEDDLPSRDDEPVAAPAAKAKAKRFPQQQQERRQEGAAAGEAEAAAIAQQRQDAQHKGGPDTDADANAGSDYDAMSDDSDASPPPLEQPPASRWTVPNGDFNPARILVNPRCVTTYAGVSHAQLALDLFGPDKEDDSPEYLKSGGKYVLEDWEGAPDSFVCQEQKQTGGRKAIKTQRRLSFSVSEELERLHEASRGRRCEKPEVAVLLLSWYSTPDRNPDRHPPQFGHTRREDSSETMHESAKDRLHKVLDDLSGIVDEIASTSEFNGALEFACVKIPVWEQVVGALMERAAQNLKDRNALLPIHQLPSEVLASILEGVPDIKSYRYYQQLKQLRGVCYHWREVVDDTPRFWTLIRGGDSIRLVEEVLKRSSNHPLDVSFYSQHYFQPDRLAAFLEKLEPHLNRLKCVHFEYSSLLVPEGWLTTVNLLTSPQASLERFSLCDVSLQTGLLELTLFADLAPRLKDLDLQGIHFDCRGAIFGGLTSLSLSSVTVPSLKELLGAISRYEALLYLSLWDVWPQSPEPADPTPHRLLLPVLRRLYLNNLPSTLKERLLHDIHAPQCVDLGLSVQADSEDPEDLITRHLPKWLFGEIPSPPEITRLDLTIRQGTVNLFLYDGELSERFHLFLSHGESVDISCAVLTGIGAVLKSHVQEAGMHLTLCDTALHLAEDGNYAEQLRCLSQVTVLELGETWSHKYCESDRAQNIQLPVFPRLQSVSFYQQPSEWIMKVVRMLSPHPETTREGSGIVVNIYVPNGSEVEKMSSAVQEAGGIVGAGHVIVSVNP
ncbi:Cryptococcal mannosyltransferase 1 [Tulasnella sp. 408]|nr:Cryptococcal mannosyltransferase 1 [Tulasnella sp. 408]